MSIRSISVVVLLACALLGTPDASAQTNAQTNETATSEADAEPAPQLPSDVAVVAPDVALPDAPEDYLSETVGEVHWDYPPQARGVVDTLQETLEQQWPRVTGELGGEIDPALVIRVGRGPEEMSALAPRGAPPPGYAVGVAYPHRGLILLTTTAPQTNERPDVESVLVHELSHIALHRAVNGNRVPRWFAEGMAIHQAHERSFERVQALWGASVGNRLLRMDQLDRAFPNNARTVGLAYAQSADFVDWLSARPNGAQKLRSVVRRVRDGQSFRTALERTYSASITGLEIDWHESLGERFRSLPLLFGSGGLWVFAAFLIVVAYARRRRLDREKIAEWARDERAAMAAAEAVSRVRGPTARVSTGPSPSEPDEDVEVIYIVPPEPRGGDGGVPTVRHEGRSHTLH